MEYRIRDSGVDLRLDGAMSRSFCDEGLSHGAGRLCHWGRCRGVSDPGWSSDADRLCRRLFVVQWRSSKCVATTELEERVATCLELNGVMARAKIWGSYKRTDGLYCYKLVVALDTAAVIAGDCDDRVDLETVFPIQEMVPREREIDQDYCVMAVPCDRGVARDAIIGWILVIMENSVDGMYLGDMMLRDQLHQSALNMKIE